jgi:hypothetical protein
MKKLHFRCIKIVQEQKEINAYKVEPQTLQCIEVVFDCIEKDPIGDHGYLHGYLAITMSADTFREVGYEVGKVPRISRYHHVSRYIP